MKVTVRVSGQLRKYCCVAFTSEGLEMEFQESTTVSDVLRKLNIPLNHTMTILVNGSFTKLESILEHGDILVLLPMAAGG